MAQNKLHVLAQDGDAKLLTAALKSGSDPNTPDNDGMTPLHYAAWYGHPNCCQALLSASADIDAFDHDGASPLHAAAYNGQLGCVIMLVESGASASMTDNESQTPKDAAIAEKHKDIVTYLRAIEEDQKRESEVERCSRLLAAAQQHAKAWKPELVKAVKDAKKRQATLEKEAKRTRKETLKLKRLRTRKGSKGSATAAAAPAHDSPTLGKLKRTKSRAASAASPVASPTTSPPPPPEARPLPDVPAVSPEVAAEMVLAEFEADEDGGGGLLAFLESLDLKDFARLVTKEVSTLEELQQLGASELQRMGLPTGARKKILAILHPK
mmetsp:Transcript_20163/g.52321  ORF Transcript_20163/g.52321 Transcript_20163/m.52321 type:complete len:325 (-) Transcript_20163:134-1108(-)|eukprot:CAMPEP_0182930006 /NCGR_PEP_ID=MMETSP0105_2-20130417/23474_1 /TAXON_ID=81532 ORGANISM="Acanthoeca-like sp., Strain 10tr" /NCGR_SAMPLE_ID=MMETSP0105_2 /ASSEMBLY_ACC=CAM_ASM_000205 /LENGTH=324 /DNA_ID=CAMNT_0025068225 /DNA_START=47 /DNA_END=1021 /DNA_ORIENTATION=+